MIKSGSPQAKESLILKKPEIAFGRKAPTDRNSVKALMRAGASADSSQKQPSILSRD
jgi:hypothetical protein